jgi:hypothetical protein
MLPSVASSRPAIIRSVVVLPQPDGPTRTANSLSWTLMFISWTATTPPTNTFFTFSSLTLATVEAPRLLFVMGNRGWEMFQRRYRATLEQVHPKQESHLDVMKLPRLNTDKHQACSPTHDSKSPHLLLWPGDTSTGGTGGGRVETLTLSIPSISLSNSI